MKKLPVYYKGSVVAWTRVDDQDYELLKDRRWCLAALRGGYVRQSTQQALNRGESRYLHRVLLKPKENPTKFVVDHLDHDPLNNQRSNLQLVPHCLNVRRRRGPQKNNLISKTLGVSFHGQSGGWYARMTVQGKHYSKYSKSFEEAVAARLSFEERFL